MRISGYPEAPNGSADDWLTCHLPVVEGLVVVLGLADGGLVGWRVYWVRAWLLVVGAARFSARLRRSGLPRPLVTGAAPVRCEIRTARAMPRLSGAVLLIVTLARVSKPCGCPSAQVVTSHIDCRVCAGGAGGPRRGLSEGGDRNLKSLNEQGYPEATGRQPACPRAHGRTRTGTPAEDKAERKPPGRRRTGRPKRRVGDL